MEKILREILDNNEWLSGWADFRDGDLMALANQEEKYQSLTEVEDPRKLYELLRSYEGAYKYRDLVFMNDHQYGCFVYKLPNTKDYVEHLNVEAMSFEKFAKIVEELNG